MDIAQVIEWLSVHKDAVYSISLIAGMIALAIGGLWTWKKKTDSNSTAGIQNQNSPNSGKQINAPVTANDHATVTQHFGDTHNNYGYDDNKVAELAVKLASEFRKEDAETIKSLQETIQALTQVNAQKYDIQQAFELLDQGDTTQAEAIFAAVAAEARQTGNEANNREAEALRHLGSLAFLHDTQKAFAAYKRSTELDTDNLSGWNQLGHLYRRLGELENAENAYMAVLKRSESNKNAQAVAYGNLGIVYRIRGDLGWALGYHEKALALNREVGSMEGMASDYGNLGIVYRIRGDLDRAIEYHEKSLTIERELGRKEGMANQYGNLGSVYQTRGDLDRAVGYYEESLALFQQLGAKDRVTRVQSLINKIVQKDFP